MANDAVHAQYEALPYPERDPREESQRLIVGSPSHLLELNHYVFGGRRDFTKPFRALVAGGGTGDAAIMLAQQLADAGQGGEVVYTDISRASRDIAESRAAVRQLDNITFHSHPIEALEPGLLGTFDYIDCCGVLHHLADPAAGLSTLKGCLADDGGMGLMVYGTYGRTGVYHVQEMLGTLDRGEGHHDRLALARRLLSALPKTNWFQRNTAVQDHFEGGEAGLYDLLLHTRDRAYRVPEIVDLLATTDLSLAALVEPARYDPASYTGDSEILSRCATLDPIERAAFAEILVGNIRTHVFYAVPRDNLSNAVAQPIPSAIPLLHNLDAAAFASAFRPGIAMTAELDGLRIQRPLPALTGDIIRHVDGQTDIDAIANAVCATRTEINRERFWKEFMEFYNALNALGRLFLHHPAG